VNAAGIDPSASAKRPLGPCAARIRSPFGSTTILDRFAGLEPAFVVSQGPIAEPSSLAPMMNDCP
jgi:hypothetical protein